jgi:chromosomal replication initiation ATPase DnaA
MSRGRHDNRAREMAIYLAQKYGEETNAALGRVFGGITGSGISYMCCKVTNKLHHNRKLRRLLERLEHDLLLEA